MCVILPGVFFLFLFSHSVFSPPAANEAFLLIIFSGCVKKKTVRPAATLFQQNIFKKKIPPTFWWSASIPPQCTVPPLSFNSKDVCRSESTFFLFSTFFLGTLSREDFVFQVNFFFL